MRIKRTKTVPRGYRLKPETHKLIARIQRIMKASADEVINKACSQYFEEINNLSGKSNRGKNKLYKLNSKGEQK